MSDAAEVLGAIYDSLSKVGGGAELVDAVFGLHVSERVHCGACGRDTHATSYTQSFYNAHATALRLQVRWTSPLSTLNCLIKRGGAMHSAVQRAARLQISELQRAGACCCVAHWWSPNLCRAHLEMVSACSLTCCLWRGCACLASFCLNHGQRHTCTFLSRLQCCANILRERLKDPISKPCAWQTVASFCNGANLRDSRLQTCKLTLAPAHWPALVA